MSTAGIARATELGGAVLCTVVGVLLLVATVLGPLVTGRVRFHMSEDALVQYVGGDLVTSSLALLFLVAAPFWSSGRAWAPALTAGGSAYVIYTFVTVVMGQEYAKYQGNAETAFLLYTAITAGSVLLLVFSVRACLALPPLPEVPRQGALALLIGLAVLFGLMWVAQLAGFYRTGPTDEYASATTLFWVIKYLDLGIIIPLLIITGLAQRHPTAVSNVAAITALGFMTWLLTAILLMSVAMLRQQAAGASWVLVVAFTVLLVPTVFVWVRWMIGASHAMT
ncbi:hypothetical protein [Ornithinimicrobium avium]|uniref:Uncharacterized protein n=1 Tax=Ornithinimicrobium avium TaxID=2283195 RepID=A0A345NKC6_9MICO|nr:hypothetical protein [Ornithinimicrobium avium]AXH95484.1 hypothetical protein DV701_04480 [Ornithinimicrobium avium]